MLLHELGPFDVVLDVGGNVGGFAEQCSVTWPEAFIVSFEPSPELAEMNSLRGEARWQTIEAAISDKAAQLVLHENIGQPSASSLQEYGPVRSERFGIRDEWRDVTVWTRPLDDYLPLLDRNLPRDGRALLKVDVEGHEAQVLKGADMTLSAVDVVIVECNEPGVFEDAATPDVIDGLLRDHGLYFRGLWDALKDPQGRVVQFDGVWSR